MKHSFSFNSTFIKAHFQVNNTSQKDFLFQHQKLYVMAFQNPVKHLIWNFLQKQEVFKNRSLFLQKVTS